MYMSQTKLIVLLGATSDLILTRQNSLKRDLFTRMQLLTKSVFVVDRVGSISQGASDVIVVLKWSQLFR